MIRDEHLVMIAENALKLLELKDVDVPTLAWFLFALSCHETCDFIIRRTCAWSVMWLQKEISDCKTVVVITPLVL